MDKNFYLYFMDGDYTPQAFGTEDELMEEGDNIHRPDIEYYAEGYSDALGGKLHRIEIDSPEDLEEHKERLLKYRMFPEFKENVFWNQ